MINVGTIILLLVCVGIGFVLEPIFFGLRENAKTETVEEAPEPEKKPEPQPAPAFDLDLSMVTAEYFPEKVKLKQTISVGYVDRKGETVYKDLQEGTEIKPLRLEGSDLVYETFGLVLESRIPVDQTNFKELVIPAIMARLRNAESTPEPEPEPEPVEVEPVLLDAEAIVALAKSSIEAGDVTEFTADQVTSWGAGADMDLDNKSYQTARVTFEAETILGAQQYKAILLVENGEVVKWIWAKTLLQMK